MKKIAYIFMLFDTLEEFHIKKALESFNCQKKSLIDTFIIYNNSSTFSSNYIKSLVNFNNIQVIDSNLPGDKKILSDINYHLKHITGFDIYFLHKSDFYLPSIALESTCHNMQDAHPRFINFSKFDMREDIRATQIKELRLLDQRSFIETSELPIASFTFRDITLQHRLIGYRGTDGTTHCYNEAARKKLHFNSFISPENWNTNKKEIDMQNGLDNVFAFHMWHNIGQKTDGKSLGKNLLGHRF